MVKGLQGSPLWSALAAGKRPTADRDINLDGIDLNVNLNEDISNEIIDLYTRKNDGLLQISSSVSKIAEMDESEQIMFPPRKGITVMIAGNHSSGKSRFINWYIDEDIQRTGVAVLTSQFTFILSGKKRQTLNGDSTIRAFPRFADASKISGLVDGLRTEVSTSKSRSFPLITFIDTPGVVEGTRYPFDVEASLEFFASKVDYIMIFFDPIGQALSHRVNTMVEQIAICYPSKVKFFLSKADTFDSEADRLETLIQVTQSLSERLSSKINWNLQTLYIPTDKCSHFNAIDDVVSFFDVKIESQVQSSLLQVERDCEFLQNKIEEKLDVQENSSKRNKHKKSLSALYGILGILVFPLLLAFVFSSRTHIDFLDDFGIDNVGHVESTLHSSNSMDHMLPNPTTYMGMFVFFFRTHIRYIAGAIVLALSVLFLFFAKITWQLSPVLGRKQVGDLKRFCRVLQGCMVKKRENERKYFASSFDVSTMH